MDTSKQVVLIWDLPVLTIIVILAIIIHFVSKKKHMPSKNTTSSLHLADPFRSSSSSSPPTWDVFLSFHGKDTRSNFTSHLYHALCQAGIQTFIDDHALEKGQEISSTLLDAIRKSNLFIIILSENYASSRWCLDELAEILSCKRTEKEVVPVFYYVDPSDVRHQKGSFGKALDRHKKRYSNNMIVKWKSALSEIAKLSGHHLRSEANEYVPSFLFSFCCPCVTDVVTIHLITRDVFTLLGSGYFKIKLFFCNEIVFPRFFFWLLQ